MCRAGPAHMPRSHRIGGPCAADRSPRRRVGRMDAADVTREQGRREQSSRAALRRRTRVARAAERSTAAALPAPRSSLLRSLHDPRRLLVSTFALYHRRGETPAGRVPKVADALSMPATASAPGACAGGSAATTTASSPGSTRSARPTAASPVLVTANYKLTFDALRSSLGELDAWLLVVDTRGINVWCAAGKGTFCAEEVARRVRETRLAEIVDHRRLVLPQLSAPGVAAHEVKEACGFRVIFGPVRAADLPAFLAAGMKADAEMRASHVRPARARRGRSRGALGRLGSPHAAGLRRHPGGLGASAATGVSCAAACATGLPRSAPPGSPCWPAAP